MENVGLKGLALLVPGVRMGAGEEQEPIETDTPGFPAVAGAAIHQYLTFLQQQREQEQEQEQENDDLVKAFKTYANQSTMAAVLLAEL